jgi:hypothetical protein
MNDTELDKTLFELATLIAAYSNPHMFFDLKDISEIERLSELESLKNLMGEILG